MSNWKERLMATAPAGCEGARLARGLIRPHAYKRAVEMGEGEDRDRGWTVLYRTMIREIENWCAAHPEQARKMVDAMKREDLLWLGYKEKWGAMRWEMHPDAVFDPDLREHIWETEIKLEKMSTEICQDCGRHSRIRAPGDDEGTLNGWVGTACDACRREEGERRAEREERGWEDRSRLWHGDEGPESRTERTVAFEDQIARLNASRWNELPSEEFAYAADVIEEWDAERGHSDYEWNRTGKEPAELPEAEHEVVLGRWRYEEAKVRVDAFDPEQAAERAVALEDVEGWTQSAGAGGTVRKDGAGAGRRARVPCGAADRRAARRAREAGRTSRGLAQAIARRRAPARGETARGVT